MWVETGLIIWTFLAMAMAAPVVDAPSRVVGGSAVAQGDWPDAVALFSGNTFKCSGVLVAPDVVLTAAHCDFAFTRAVVGSNDWRDGTSVDVESSTSYENFWSTYDIAVVKLVEPITDVEPRVLATDCVAEQFVINGAEVSIVGFGATDPFATDFDSLLYEATSVLVDSRCSNTEEGCNLQVAPGGEVIAGGDGVDSCLGDSGGPLYLHTLHGEYLLGLTSRAVATAEEPCGDGGIYARPDAVVEWIESVADVTLQGPDCDVFNHSPVLAYTDTLVGSPGETIFGDYTVSDPDGDVVTTDMGTRPAFGSVNVVDGQFSYEAPRGSNGDTFFTLIARDDGEPSLATEVVVNVEVIGHVGPVCACQTGSTASWWVLLLPFVTARRSCPRSRRT